MKLTIIAGLPFNADFTVLSTDGMTPVYLDPEDSATFTLSTAGVNPTVVIDAVAMVVVDYENGLFTINLDASQTMGLEQEVGFAEDKYPTQNKYKAILQFNLVSGDRDATMPIYVEEIM